MFSNLKDSFEFVKTPTLSPVHGIPVQMASPSLLKEMVSPAPVENQLGSKFKHQSGLPSFKASVLKSEPGPSHPNLLPSAHGNRLNLPQLSNPTPALPQPSKNSSSHPAPSSAHPKAPCPEVPGEAEPFVFSPKIYNEKHLLKTYPKTFRTPQKVDMTNITADKLISTIEDVVVHQGKPLVIQNFHLLSQFDEKLFSLEWLKANKESVQVTIRNLKEMEDEDMSFSKFLAANEGKHHKEIKYYGKDLNCPEEWHTAVKGLLNPYLHYLGPNDMNCKQFYFLLTDTSRLSP